MQSIYFPLIAFIEDEPWCNVKVALGYSFETKKNIKIIGTKT